MSNQTKMSTQMIKSKFDRYLELNRRFQEQHLLDSFKTELSEEVKYLIRQAYCEGYSDGQNSLTPKLFELIEHNEVEKHE